MELRRSLYDARQTIVRAATDAPPMEEHEDKSPFDAHKYHRAFVAGLMGFPAGLIAFVGLYNAGDVLMAVVTLFASFFGPFSLQLGAEYGIKPKE